MSERSNIGANREITAEACAWVAQLESGDLSGADLAALREWMARSPAHAREIREVAMLSGKLAVLTEMAEPLAQAAALDSGLRKSRRAWVARAAIFASAFAACALAAALFLDGRVADVSPGEPLVYETAVGEYRVVRLSDGTSMKLNTDTSIEVDYEPTARGVRLLKGEAVFDVAHDPSRPFVVYAGETAAEAIGTSFLVRLRDKVTELSVIEGVVGFSRVLEAARAKPAKSRPQSEPAPLARIEKTPAVFLKAGEALTSIQIPPANAPQPAVDVVTIAPRELERKLSWTDGLFDFSDAPLQEVVEEINRYNRVRVQIVDPDLKAMKFGGIFETGDLNALLEALEKLGVRVERVGDDRILLRAAEKR